MLARESGSASRVLRNLSPYNKPWQMALAISLGILAGLVPKSNLLAIVIYASIIVLPVHTLLAIGVSVLVTCCAIQLDPWTHRLGMWLLEHPKAERLWLWLESLPLVPWFSFHNSVILGSLITGLALFYPVFVIAYSVLKWIDSFDDCRKESHRRSFEVLAPMIEQPAPLVAPRNPDTLGLMRTRSVPDWHIRPPALSRAVMTLTVAARSSSAFDEASDGLEVARRASEMACWADEALQECLNDDRQIPVVAVTAESASPNPDQRFDDLLRETSPQHPPAPVCITATHIDANLQSKVDALTANPSVSLHPQLAILNANFEPRSEFNVAARSSDCSLKLADTDNESTVNPDEGDEEWLIETTIEVVRLAEEAVAKKRDEYLPKDREFARLMMPSQDVPSTSTHMLANPAAEGPLIEAPVPVPPSIVPQKSHSATARLGEQNGDGTTQIDTRPPSWTEGSGNSQKLNCVARESLEEDRQTSDHREEALRHLLRHLRKIKERA